MRGSFNESRSPYPFWQAWARYEDRVDLARIVLVYKYRDSDGDHSGVLMEQGGLWHRTNVQ